MNIHDKRRRDAVIKTLAKAKEQAQEADLYLTANNRPTDEIYAVNDALVHIERAMECLGVVPEEVTP